MLTDAAAAARLVSSCGKNEWLTYLNERLAQTEPLQVIYALEVEQANEDKIALAVSEDYMLQF